MKAYLVEHALGSFLYDENGEIKDYELNFKSVQEAVENCLAMERGEQLAGTTAKLLQKLKENGFNGIIVVEDERVARLISAQGFEVEVAPHNHVALKFRDNVGKIAVETKFVDEEKKFWEWMHELTIEVTRRKLRETAQKRDLLAAQAVRTIDDIDKIINLLIARLREWYSLHFPELNKEVKDHELYAKIVAELGTRDNMTKERLEELGMSPEQAERIAEKAKKSIGAELTERDVEELQKVARIILQLYQLRRDLTEYISYIMKEVAPNITALVGPVLGARLISLAGSLENLAKMPASTIQVLGAEKALFRALRTGGKPPKHGIIFQYPHIHRSPRWQRGKIARALAAKLAIAAKVDYFTKRNIGDKLREELEKRIQEIKETYKKPPKREERREERKPRRPPRRKGGRRGGRRGGKGRKK